MNPGEIDKLGREAIVEYLDKNLFVIAGAGSGKTTMLVSRMVYMVESGIDISKICAITFTKKAAAEFLSRFQSLLKERSKPPFKEGHRYPGDLPTPTKDTALLCQKALENIDLCFTGTIDSFCNLVLSEYPNNAGIPSSSEVIEEDEFISLCKKEYEKIANEKNSPLRDKFLTFNKLMPNAADTFARSINDVIEVSHLNIEHPLPRVSLEEAVNELKAKYEQRIHDDVKALLKLEGELVTDKQKYIDAFNQLKKNSSRLLASWDVSNFTEIRKSVKYTFTEDLRFVDQPSLSFFEFAPVSKVYKCVVGEALKEYFNDVDKIVYTYAMDFLLAAADDIKKSLKEQGKLSFNEYLMTFRNMVIKDMSKGMKLINHIRHKHSYFLIDESQDTSPAQTELFIYLTSQVEAHSLRECQPIPGSLFIVGDPKQSIYGFRGADVNAYLSTKDLFEHVYDQDHNQVIYLTRNFRSSLSLCQYFNDKFAELDNFEPIPLDGKSDGLEGSLNGLYQSDNYLAAIKEIVGKQFITVKNIKRLVEYKDIMLLTWSTSRHDKMIKELMANDIPVYCEGKFYINDNALMEVVYAIYAYIASGSGTLTNLLASPLFNASVLDLIGVSSIEDIPEGKEKNLLLSIAELRSIHDPVLLFTSIIDVLKIYQYVNFTNMEYAYFALEGLKNEVAHQNVSDIQSAEHYLRDFLSNKLERCMNMEYVPNAVNLANVHKVKGLEKPVVILASDMKRDRDPVSDSNYYANKAYVFKTGAVEVNNNVMYDIDSADLFSDEIEEAKAKRKEEDKRLGYVAVTRARSVLIMPPYSDKASNPWGYVQVDNLPLLPHSSLPDVEVKKTGAFSYEKPGEFISTSTYWQKSPSKEGHIYGKYEEDGLEEKDDIFDIDARTKGTVIHRLMEVLVNSKAKISREALITQIMNEYSLSELSSFKGILESVYDTMCSGGYPQVNGTPQDLLKILEKASLVRCETPFSFKEGKAIWQGTIDLLYEIDDKFFIVDYKTNADEEGLVEKYQSQLEAYQKAVFKAFGKKAKAFIYHIKA